MKDFFDYTIVLPNQWYGPEKRYLGPYQRVLYVPIEELREIMEQIIKSRYTILRTSQPENSTKIRLLIEFIP